MVQEVEGMMDDDFEDDEGCPEFEFECAGFWEADGSFYCPLWGTEECDWECPNGGIDPTEEDNPND